MKKWILILGLITAFHTNAEELPSCGENCTYSYVENGTDDNGNPTYTLTISPIDASKPAEIKDYERNVYLNTPNMLTYELYLGTNEAAPWYAGGIDKSITKIEIGEGITSVGKHAFSDMTKVTEVTLPDGLEKIENVAFHAMSSLKSIDLPNSVKEIQKFGIGNSALTDIGISEGLTKIGESAFCGIKAENFVVPAGVTEISQLAFTAVNGTENRTWKTTGIKNLYCTAEMKEQCEAALSYASSQNALSDIKVIEYESKGGVYVIGDDYYLSADDMKKGDTASSAEEKAQYACTLSLKDCKKQALINRGICQGADCDALVENDGKYMLKFGGRTYQSINDLLKGNYDVRRIYTVEEASFVSGKKNTV
ncbi:MAG: leucine-rich repeat domain-containing protein, partial [Alphaproteobacteria bacterium]|nr:leucine-rich repeat domain-containing protein [Alphaproteobacteria bacterium]